MAKGGHRESSCLEIKMGVDGVRGGGIWWAFCLQKLPLKKKKDVPKKQKDVVAMFFFSVLDC